MLATYKAILRGNQLEWHEQAPKMNSQEPVAVYVTLLHEPTIAAEKSDQGMKMAAALASLAAHPYQTITDPLTWEQEQRQERSLPQRP